MTLPRALTVVAIGAAVWFLSAHAQAAILPPMEAGQTTGVDATFRTVQFTSPFPQAPLVFYLLDDANDFGSGIRVRNVTTHGFEMAQLEAPNIKNGNSAAYDGDTPPDTVHWLAIEPGVHNIGPMKVMAGSVMTTRTRKKGGGDQFETIDLSAAGFTNAPAVMTAVNTYNNNSAGSDDYPAWIQSMARDANLSATGTQIALEIAEAFGTEGSVSVAPVTEDEKLAYLAFDVGPGSLSKSLNDTFTDVGGNTIEFAAVFQTNNINGEANEGANGQIVNFGTTFSTSDAQVVAVGSHASDNGDDGGWLRQKYLTTSQIGVYLQEDQFQDSELAHGSTERGVILAFSQPFTTIVIPEPSTLVVWSLLAGLGIAVRWKKTRRSERA